MKMLRACIRELWAPVLTIIVVVLSYLLAYVINRRSV
jgi:hypothetical protein